MDLIGFNLKRIEKYGKCKYAYISQQYTHFPGFIKGLVHPKMKIKSLITHPRAVPTP